MHWWIGQVGPRGAEWGRVGQCEQGRLVLSGVGEGLGMHWIQLNYSKTTPWLQG